MTWLAQVGHVVRRDLRALRLGALAYMMLVALVTLRELEVVPSLVGSGILGGLLYIATVVVAASAVLDDSPMRPDAFWALLPLRGSAVAAGKVVLLFGLVAVAVLAAHVVRLGWKLPSDALPLGGSIDGVRFAAVLMPYLLIASACRNLRTFGAAVLLLFVGSNLLGPLFPGRPPALPEVVAAWILGTAAVVGALLLGVRYTRPRDDLLSTAGVVAGSTAFVGLLMVAQPVERVAMTPRELAGTEITLVADEQPICEMAESRLLVPVRVQAAPGRRVDLLSPSLTITTTAGVRIVTAQPSWGQVMGIWGELLPLRTANAPWKTGAQTLAPKLAVIAFPLTPADLSRACGAVARLALDLDVHVSEARELVRVPARAGAVVTAPGVRARVLDVVSTPVSARATVVVSELGAAGQSNGSSSELKYALVDEATGEALTPNSMMNTPDRSRFRMSELPGLVHASSGSVAITFVSEADRGPLLPSWTSHASLLVARTVTRDPMRIHREITLQPPR